MTQRRHDVRGRLQTAAWELYGERGYERTTTAEIAARAGVTERTFFRHFPDKREVAFEGAAQMLETMTTAIAEAPASLEPMALLLQTLQAMAPVLEANRATNAARQTIIAATPALQERQFAKAAAMTAALEAALKRRGMEAKLASLTAQCGMAVFNYAMRAWQEEPSIGLSAHLEAALRALQGLYGVG